MSKENSLVETKYADTAVKQVTDWIYKNCSKGEKVWISHSEKTLVITKIEKK